MTQLFFNHLASIYFHNGGAALTITIATKSLQLLSLSEHLHTTGSTITQLTKRLSSNFRVQDENSTSTIPRTISILFIFPHVWFGNLD